MLIELKKNIRLNKATGLYTAREAGRNYQVDPSVYKSLLDYLTQNDRMLIADWYRSLSEADKQKVIVSTW